ncbi:MAG: GNAT family N-acetyltransferase [Candidatus Aenigmarchaeota archaeon]|nr:GNAT family N-acetyltransferase [Candidatus Aenigmarchaeota archaeon]
MIIRHATEKDVQGIYKIGTSTTEFEVSRKIKFYKKSELLQWIKDRKGNIVLVAVLDGKIAGFASCKIMSHHWAMVDNFYVLKKYRKEGIGSQIEDHLERELRKKKVKYVTRLVGAEHKNSRIFLKKRGFKEHDKYIWIDKFL